MQIITWGRSTFAAVAVAAAISVAAGGTAAGADEDGFAGTADAPAPRIVVPDPAHDFGRIDRGSVVTHVFEMRNEGTADLEILDVMASCGCTAVLLSTTALDPGDSGRVEVTFDTGDRRGRQAKTVTILSNDPERPQLHLRVMAMVEVVFDFETASLYMGKIREGQSATRSCFLLVRDLDSTEITGITTSSPLVIVRRVPFDPSAPVGDPRARKDHLDNPDRVRMEVTVRPGLPRGRFSESVTVRSNLENRPEAVLTVTGVITGDVEVTPGWLSYVVGGGSRRAPIAKRILVTNNRRDVPVTLEELQDTGGMLDLEVKTLIEGVRYEITATLREGVLAGRASAGGSIVIPLDGVEQDSLSVRYRVVSPGTPDGETGAEPAPIDTPETETPAEPFGPEGPDPFAGLEDDAGDDPEDHGGDEPLP